MIEVVDLMTGEQRSIYNLPEKGYINAVAVSPDGGNLAVTMSTTVGQKPVSRVLLMDVKGSNVRTLFENQHPEDVKAWAGIAWASDGQQVFFVRSTGEDSEKGQIWRMPINGGPPQPTGIQGPRVHQINASKTGRLAYTGGLSNISELWTLENVLSVLSSSR